jgi:peptidyl-prolyl cis-trans isomerase SurA
MNKRSSLVIIYILMSVSNQAQELNNKILMTVGANKIQAGEFIRMYNKSAEQGNLPNIDDYLQQYVDFKLKVADAINEHYDTTKAFKNELKGYRNQLSEQYLTDPKTKEELIKQAYQRSLTEINVWHILVALSQDASPEDTVKAWEKISAIRERIIQGEPFEQVARGTSDDQSVKINGGNLGYITTFQTIMPFEDAAFSLKKGSISAPVRTPDGYHIIKVTDKRPSKGRIRVAHIMKNSPPGSDDNTIKQAESEINNIYNMLLNGSSFEELANKYSDHRESAVKGGKLDWFGTGDVINDFAEPAFSLKDTGDFTKPVRTTYGWHIIKLLEKKSPGSFEDSRSYIESKINKSYLNSMGKKSLIDKLKKDYNYRLNNDLCQWFINNTDTLTIKGLKKYDRATIPTGNIYSFANQHCTTIEFAKYIEQRGSMINTKDSSLFINQSLNLLTSDHILNYENSILETKYPEFRYLMNEFHDGILLFEISGNKLWNIVSNDTSGLRKYYNNHKNNYLTTPGIEGKIYSYKASKDNDNFVTFYKKNADKNDFEYKLLKKFTTKNDSLILEKNTWFRGNDNEIDSLDWAKRTQYIKRKGYPAVLLIERKIDPVPMEFEKVKVKLMSDFQENIEREWLRQLKENFSVKIDTSVFKAIKKMTNNE